MLNRRRQMQFRVVIITIVGIAAWLPSGDLSNRARPFMSSVALAGDRSYGMQSTKSDAFADFKQGQAYANQKQYEKAVEAFTTAEHKGLVLYELFVFRGFAYHELNQLQKAQEDAEKAIALQPTRILGYELLAAVHYAMNHPNDTIEVVTRGLARVEGLEKAKLQKTRGILFLKLGRQEEAIRDLTQAEALGHAPAVLYHSRGRAYSELGQYEFALRDYSESLTIKPSDNLALRDRGWVYGCIGEFDKALTDFDHILAMDQEDVLVHSMRGWTRLNTGDVEGALADLNYAVAHGDQDPWTFLGAADGYYLQGNMTKALEVNEQGLALKNADKDADARYRLQFQRGLFLLVKGREEEALRFYKEAEVAASKQPDPLTLKEAIADIRGAIHVHPQIAKAADSLLKELERTLAETKPPHKPRPNQCQRLSKRNG
ncbi:MAG: tetratricopeptide repeat protein [Nitrospira sp.]|nr:tetratricopeptide repeat protein [Nitrospira sp.]